MASSEALARAKAKYNKLHIKSIGLKFHREKEADMVSWIESKDNIQGYIKQLIKEDMEKRQ